MKTAVILSAFAATVLAQASNFSSCCSIDPNTVQANVRASWCRAQMNTCPLLCTNGQTSQNTCDQNALTYQCSCSSGTTPNVTDYAQTLPSLQCDEWKAQCTAAHPNDLNGQTFCQSYICGKKNASASAVTTSGSSSSSASAASSASGTSAATSTKASTAASSSSAAVAALGAARDYGTFGLAIGLLAAFGLGL